MSTFLTAQSVTLSHTSTPVFDNLTFTINRGNKIGLIGHNGCGKSSLLKLLSGQCQPTAGQVSQANHCLMSYVEQHIPPALQSLSVIKVLADRLSKGDEWQAELLLAELHFDEADWHMPVANCSGGQQMRLLLARAIINAPDLLLLDEPSNHLDLPSLLWLERFLSTWKGSFVLVSHDQTLLDAVTNTTWIMRDQSLYHYSLPCTQARAALAEKDEQDRHRHASEQKEIDRIEKSAKRLAMWGKVYDNEDLARKAKTMMARKERLKAGQTELTEGAPWRLQLQGDSLAADRLLEILPFAISPPGSDAKLFSMPEMRIKSGDRVAILGSNGCGKSTLLNLLYALYRERYAGKSEGESLGNAVSDQVDITFHDRCRLGYYDQSQQQIGDEETLVEGLSDFASVSLEQSKMSLISAGFEYARHAQTVASLSGGERARLLFIGLTLANYHLLLLDEPTNHLDMDGKAALAETLSDFEGAVLLVSHDRQLIEQGCNRFWLIQQGELKEYLSVDEVYAQIAQEAASSSPSGNGTSADQSNRAIPESVASTEQDRLLARLIELEELLANDRRQKPKRQNHQRQQAWQAEIEAISAEIL